MKNWLYHPRGPWKSPVVFFWGTMTTCPNASLGQVGCSSGFTAACCGCVNPVFTNQAIDWCFVFGTAHRHHIDVQILIIKKCACFGNMKASRTQMTHVFKSLKPQNWGSKYPKMEVGWVQISIHNDWVFAIPITYHLWPSKGSFPCSLDFIRPSPAKIWCLPIGRCHFAIHLWWFHKPLQPSEAYLFLQRKGNTETRDVQNAPGCQSKTPPVIVYPCHGDWHSGTLSMRSCSSRWYL